LTTDRFLPLCKNARHVRAKPGPEMQVQIQIQILIQIDIDTDADTNTDMEHSAGKQSNKQDWRTVDWGSIH